jgi:hypothetical protein
MLQARLAQFHFTSEFIKGVTQVYLDVAQRLAANTVRAKVAAEQERNTLSPLCKKQPDNSNFAAWLGLPNAMLGEKEAALKERNVQSCFCRVPKIEWADLAWKRALR